MTAAPPPEVIALALKIADSAARSDVECWCFGIGMTPTWYDTRQPKEPEENWPAVAEAIRYLELRGLLMRHESDQNLVRFKKEGEA